MGVCTPPPLTAGSLLGQGVPRIHSSPVPCLAHTGSFFVSSTLLNFHVVLMDSVELMIFIFHIKCRMWLGLSSFEHLIWCLLCRFMQIHSGKSKISSVISRGLLFAIA